MAGHGLESYCGGSTYAKEFTLEKRHLAGRTFLDLGGVGGTAEMHLNDVVADVGLARPYRLNITDHVREGGNRLEVIVYNTLANHYSVGIPSKYVFEGQTVSVLFGPVQLHFASEVNLIGRPGAKKYS